MKEITQEQQYEAYTYVRSYYQLIGKDPDAIDWESKPSNLPDDVSRAWDTYLEYWNQFPEDIIL